MEPLEKLRQIRIEKLEKLRQLGIDPYPARTGVRNRISEVREQNLGSKAQVAGRIRGWREHGKIIFADLVDESGKIQLVFKPNELRTTNYELLPLLDIGDFVGVAGNLFKTDAGELSIEVKDLILLAKSLRPLPEKHEGLKDIETRYRQRYLDLITNSEVKQVFETRARVVSLIREFLNDRGYIGVETPLLQPLYGGGLARPFKTFHNALGIPMYLRISTELYLKRLIVGGFEKVYEIAKLFRNEGIDRQHNPEFTILETMEAYISYKENMELTEQMFEFVTKEITGGTVVRFQGQKIDFKAPWERLTMVEAVKSATGIDFSEIRDFDKAKEETEELGINLENTINNVGLVLAAVFEEKVEPTLIQPTFIYDFPVETSPLAKRCPNDPRFVERFEHFVAGMEMSNNYSELNNPLELAERFKDERKKERLGDEEAHQTDTDFIEAVEYGMPPTSGLGPSIDRYVMVVTNSPSIRDVILFPTMRPEKGCDGNIQQK